MATPTEATDAPPVEPLQDPANVSSINKDSVEDSVKDSLKDSTTNSLKDSTNNSLNDSIDLNEEHDNDSQGADATDTVLDEDKDENNEQEEKKVEEEKNGSIDDKNEKEEDPEEDTKKDQEEDTKEDQEAGKEEDQEDQEEATKEDNQSDSAEALAEVADDLNSVKETPLENLDDNESVKQTRLDENQDNTEPSDTPVSNASESETSKQQQKQQPVIDKPKKQTPNLTSNISLIKDTLTDLLEEKDLKKNTAVQKVVEHALSKHKDLTKFNTDTIDSISIFEALRACCRSSSTKLQFKALDCLSKLFSFRALDETILINPPDCSASNDQTEDSLSGVTPPPKQKLIDAAIDTISDCFQGESTDPKVELQIVRALSSCILVEDVDSLCHGASLLKAVRTIYNVFILSLSSSNQGIAQATLIQIVGGIFSKIDLKKTSSSNDNSSSKNQMTTQESLSNVEVDIDTNISTSSAAPLTLQNMSKLNDEDEKIVDSQQTSHDIPNSQELIIRDAFLVFRTMVKMSAKTLEADMDMRSHSVRSKLLALHLIHSMLRDHIDVFLSDISFKLGKNRITLVDAIRQYLCLSLTRNASSPISSVYEITLEIMWILISNLRVAFRREIPVFLTEIYFPISELKTSTSHQKRYFLYVMQRLCNDPRTLIEFYLNYDCNTGMPNIMEILVDYLTRLALTRVEVSSTQKRAFDEQVNKSLATYNLSQLPLLSISNLSSSTENQDVLPFPVDYALKMSSLNCIVSILRSLSSWAHKALHPVSELLNNSIMKNVRASRSLSVLSSSERRDQSNLSLENSNMDDGTSSLSHSQDVEDPMQFDNLKQRKTDLSECVRIFNMKPKRAIPKLISKGFLTDDTSQSIAKWLLETDGLDLAKVGDYLGEGNDENIAIMHAFIDEFDFSGLSIVDALRAFLQKFRLPGEGQKIDRFMLKFAERFCDQNPGVFSKADTAYVLSYSIIMLNTDLHSSQIKNRMTLQEFLENNEGIDNGNDLPKEFLVGIFDEISANEIKLLSEQHEAMLNNDENLIHQQPQSAFNFFSSRDMVREAYMQVSKEISSKTELVFKNLNKTKKDGSDDVFYGASHVEHVKSIFETLWMSFLAALTPPFKEYDDIESTSKCLEGLKISIKISTIFGIDDARKSFIGALVQFCNLQNVEELKVKNINAITILLEEALSEGTFFKDSWKDVLLVISQVERLQLISKGIDRNTVPDVSQARVAGHRGSIDSTRTANASIFDIWSKKATPAELAQEKHNNQTLAPEISKSIVSSELVVLMDNIFTRSAELSGDAIVDFITAMTDVALDEIESSQDASTPRMFSLQKMVDVCYYNMDRIKVEWTPIWAVMGSAFNQIATNANLAVVFFAIDSLRQLSMRFLDIEELSGFEFKCDFLQPFKYTIQHTSSNEVQEMILECYTNFIKLKAPKIKSGWKPILESLQFTARSKNEHIVGRTFKLAYSNIVANHLEDVFIQDDTFGELTEVFKEISKNKKYQKLSLHALESLRSITKEVARICYSTKEEDMVKREKLLHGKDVFQDIWFPLLFCFNDTIMTAEDLEVRSRALDYMFDSLVTYGSDFSDEFWGNVCTKLLFPIFGVLSKHWEVNQFNSHDDLSVWLSTTLIQALRNLISLFTHYFESLNKMLDGFLGLLVSCICQENDTIARIGRACLQQLILQNILKFDKTHWEEIGKVFERLFELTTASELFDYDPLHKGRQPSVTKYVEDAIVTLPEGEDNNSTIEETVQRAHDEESSEDVGKDMETVTNKAAPTDGDNDTNENTLVSSPIIERQVVKKLPNVPTNKKEELRHRINVKNSIVVKCVLQLLMIELLSELFENDDFLSHIPDEQSFKVTGLLEKSYEFARDFNEDYELRTRLVGARVVDKIPNLLKQETSAAAVLIDILFKLYLNGDEKKDELIRRLISICVGVVKGYIALDDRTMERSINTWRPVIVEILQGYYEFDDEDFKKYCPVMYKLVMNILDKSVPTELRQAVKRFLGRVGHSYLSGMDAN
ncbi:hypothetical protein TBLA_0A04220 [Henningerozyma blattae CBS 6284]|uniref:SEC7 domain-containing protein n=1 Tax=Henningerozyma blattae (strain ATCC 34711 / CBS 6284 / DSM 70876 / NBRC 10599 / NRRL Y-10934 / UCD 77-7) TaxID=1071380 RepID=I2GVR6_HENB6|nr:hypothetical protein TBLA_0A04220 [Tetrapisispora blattae CBS 6284]CCH58218.1 hypothetical protein TBLA_0A04220 [Tetrapisispora blattae CBS 6284]